MKNVALSLTSIFALSLVFVPSVLADAGTATPTPTPITRVVKSTRQVCTTTYGGATECRDEVVEETIVSPPLDVTEIETGVGSIALIVTTLVLGGAGLFTLAQKQLS